jgi:hypothetical protein
MRKMSVSFVMSYVRPSVCLSVSHWKDFHENWYWKIFRKCAQKIQIRLKYDKNSGTSCENVWKFMIMSRLMLLRLRKIVETIKTHFRFNIFFLEQRDVYDLMWENMVEPVLSMYYRAAIRWIIEPTDATIIRRIFLELNQSKHVSGIIMPIIRRTRTRLVKTSCGDVWLCWLWLCGAVV